MLNCMRRRMARKMTPMKSWVRSAVVERPCTKKFFLVRIKVWLHTSAKKERPRGAAWSVDTERSEGAMAGAPLCAERRIKKER